MELLYCLLLVLPASADMMTPTVEVRAVKRQPDTISIAWSVNDTSEVIDYFKVTAEKVAIDGMKITFEGQKYQSNKATLHLAEANTNYTICVIGVLKNMTVTIPNSEIMDCEYMATIKVVQLSSVLGLFFTILFFVMCVVIAVIGWKCSQRRHTDKRYSKTDVNGNGDTLHLTRDASSSIEA